MFGRNTLLSLAFCSLAACAVFSRHTRKVHAQDVELPAPGLASGQCSEGMLLDPASLYTGRWQLAETRPDAGTLVAIDGNPIPNHACTLLACDSACCDNECDADPACAYKLQGDRENTLCLGRADFSCGGTDCSDWCKPFGTQPRHRYRFVGWIRYRGLEMPASSVPVADLEVKTFCRLDQESEADGRRTDHPG